MNEKICKYCNRSFPDEDFGVAKTTSVKVFRRRKCRYCYGATKQSLIDRYTNWMNAYKKMRGCKICKISDPRVLDFHHRESESKLITIGGFRNNVGIKRIKKEIEKCDIVCANCHRILHHEMRAVQKRL